jgi:hypothetical protein
MPKVKINSELIEKRYANWVSMFIDMVSPKDLYFIGGRGTAKTESILAKRSKEVIESMPGGVFSWICDTYVNAFSNVIPNLITGWKRLAFYENIHYVMDQPPPLSWRKKATKRLGDYRRTISFYEGQLLLVKSMDHPSAHAGISSVHEFGDEGKYDSEDKLKKIHPTLRGDRIKFGHSPWFRGVTFTSDRANPADGEYDWMNKMEEHMDLERIYYILQAAFIVNDERFKLYDAIQKNKSKAEIRNIEINLQYWESLLNKARMNTTLFYRVSSLANIDILSFQYIIENFEKMSYEEFKTAIFSLKPSVERGARFYPMITDKHFYTDGYNYDYYDQFGMKDNITMSCLGLKYLKKGKPLEAGFDAGNMMSLCIGQDHGDTNRIMKFFYTLTPEWIPELATKFKDFFKTHDYKLLDLYYDRAANQYRTAGKDFATQLKKEIETDNGRPSGWMVNLMSIGQGDIEHQTEYEVCTSIFSEKDRRLPKILIDRYECKEVKASVELATAKTIIGKNGRKTIQKVKTSEKKKLSELPMGSTNPSDAMKYYICRPKWIKIVKHKTSDSLGSMIVT